MSPRTIQRCLHLLLILLSVAGPAGAGGLYVKYERWKWTEKNEAGQQLLTEEGPLLALGVTGERSIATNAALAGRLEGFLGEVDYDGATQLGDPIQTTTEYYGLTAEGDARWRLHAADHVDLLPLAGLGTRCWLRRIDHTSRFSSGYDEVWYTAYGLIGGRAEWRPASPTTLFVEAVAQVPFYDRVRYNLSSDGGDNHATVKPDGKVTLHLQAGARHGAATLALFYDRLAFGRSESESSPPFEVFQPESDGHLLGLQVGVDL